ncbi:MAG TPA: transposase [Tepidisphaeraceae bacterium]|nr:transposase [Tepidisphaeraceae bacterium]
MGETTDRELWARVTAAVSRAVRAVGRRGRECKFADALVVRMYLWAAWHDRPLCWACDRAHYNTLFRPRQLPSVSQFTRRVKTDVARAVLQRVHDDLAARGIATGLSALDGKPLTVSPVSRDRDARRGHVSGGFAKGYKLHAWVTDDGRLPLWAVTPLNADEKTVARLLCESLPEMPPDALALADANFDAAPLHKRVARAGARLLCPLRGQGRTGDGGHHAVTLRQMGAARRELVALWAAKPDLCDHVLHHRNAVERGFSTLTCHGGGLAALPAWVRTIGRVTRWVGAKIILYHARLRAQRAAAKLAAA